MRRVPTSADVYARFTGADEADSAKSNTVVTVTGGSRKTLRIAGIQIVCDVCHIRVNDLQRQLCDGKLSEPSKRRVIPVLGASSTTKFTMTKYKSA